MSIYLSTVLSLATLAFVLFILNHEIRAFSKAWDYSQAHKNKKQVWRLTLRRYYWSSYVLHERYEQLPQRPAKFKVSGAALYGFSVCVLGALTAPTAQIAVPLGMGVIVGLSGFFARQGKAFAAHQETVRRVYATSTDPTKFN